MTNKSLPGHIRERKNKHGETTSYEGRINDPYLKTEAGFPFTHTESFSTRAEAENWLNKRQIELFEKGSIALTDTATVAEFCNDWLDKVAVEGDDGAGPLRASTLRYYKEHIDRYILRKAPTQATEEAQSVADAKQRASLASVLDIGSEPVSALRAKDLERWLRKFIKLKGRGLAKRVLRDLKAALRHAAVQQNLPDVWSNVRLRKDRREDRGVEIVLSTEQARAIMDGAIQLRDRGYIVAPDGTPSLLPEERHLDERIKNSNAGTRRKAWARWAPLLWLLFRAGLRIGEGLALIWQDVDWDAGGIRVERTVSDQARRIEETKTASGTRLVLLDAETMDVLRAYKAWCEEPRSKKDMRSRRRTDPKAYMFGTKGGDNWDNHSNFRRAWDYLFAALDLLHADGRSWASPHDARHWHASALFAAGVPLEDVSARLGHSTTTVTADI